MMIMAAIIGLGSPVVLVSQTASAENSLRRFCDNPTWAINHARQFMEDGDLPAAIALFRNALRNFPADRELQTDLQLARSLVDAPHPTLAGLQYYCSFNFLFAAFAIAVALAAVAAAMQFTRRPRWAYPAMLIGFAGALIVAGTALWMHSNIERERAVPFIVATRTTVLREGNGASYPLIVELPRGTEATVRHVRGGWVQVELADGRRGWLPQQDVLMP